ncbi:MAG: acyl carrier protein [Butyrivibrio sp.]|nr:acyl carrier protein [Acetatifactor muris]MCM1559373.1 acyl carrier protein [Butyrivibrio sp.]
MSRDEIFGKVKDLCRVVFADDELEVTSETTARDVEMWDSLTHVVLISEIERAFGIKFKLDEMQKARNIGELVHIVESKVR